MRKLVALIAVAGVVLGMAGAVSAKPPHYDDHGVPRHGHLKLIGVTYDGDEPVMYRKCIELPKVPNHAHHRMLHTGHAGGPHIFIPMQPLSPFSSCAVFAELVGPPNTYIPPES
jgi:hypothetical protein